MGDPLLTPLISQSIGDYGALRLRQDDMPDL
jgi:hypothetical protein